MRNLIAVVSLGLGFMVIQSCSKQSAVCDCIDMSTEMMQGDRENNYDGTFRKKYIKEHQATNEKCEKLAEGVNGEASQVSVVNEMEKCSGYDAFNKELSIQSVQIEKKMKKEIEEELKKMKE